MISENPAPADRLDRLILFVRGHKAVFDAIRALMEPPPGPPKPRIGFHRP